MHDGVLDYLETEVTQLFNDQYWSSSFCVTTTRLLDSINLRLIPFGNSEYYKRANNYKCQNGTQECKAQFYQYCALKKYDVYNSFPYYKCIQAYAFLRILMLIVIGTVTNCQIGLGNVLTTTSLIRLTWRAALKIVWMYVTRKLPSILDYEGVVPRERLLVPQAVSLSSLCDYRWEGVSEPLQEHQGTHLWRVPYWYWTYCMSFPPLLKT